MAETMNKVVQTNRPQHNMRKAWLALIVVLIATFMGILNTTIVNIAIPTIMSNAHGGFNIPIDH